MTTPCIAPQLPGCPSPADAIVHVYSRHLAGTDLERLTAAVELSELLGRSGRELVQHFVTNARAIGEPWSAIAGVLAVSRQAAHKRFAQRPEGDLA